jgi:hypothetical protein
MSTLTLTNLLLLTSYLLLEKPTGNLPFVPTGTLLKLLYFIIIRR